MTSAARFLGLLTDDFNYFVVLFTSYWGVRMSLVGKLERLCLWGKCERMKYKLTISYNSMASKSFSLC